MLGLLWTNTRLRIASILTLIWIVYLLFNFDSRAAISVPLAVLVTVCIELVLTYARKRRLFFPASALVTGLLIGLIISPHEPPMVFLLAAFLAIASKHIFRLGEHRHIFNPAAFGILGVAFITGAPVAWWAVSFSPWIIPLIVSASYTLYQLKRLWLPITFLATYGLYFLLFVPKETLLPILLDGTVFLFAFVMLPEPITSPSAGRWKYAFGPLVFVVSILIGRIGQLPDVFLPALLLGNILAFFLKRN